MARFLLVHGAWHGAWCWYKVLPRLERAGHRVQALDLPGHGVDRRPVAGLTIDDYAGAMLEALTGDDEPAVLVGHSMGGGVISRMAERAPERCAHLIYLCAFLPESGVSLLEQGIRDQGTRLGECVELTESGETSRVQPGKGDPVFYGDCSPEDRALASRLLVEESIAAVSTPLEVSAERWGRVSRGYVACAGDQAISLAMQQDMIGRSPCEPVITLDSAHSPFFSAPDELVEALVAQLPGSLS